MRSMGEKGGFIFTPDKSVANYRQEEVIKGELFVNFSGLA
jgi:hypothetical protein